MSHHHDSEPKTCPNCGYPATQNYCAQCGQETHLHKDTFFGLIWHFVSHYFHYDSKFWKTLKKLWFAPGKLTLEYLEGKRARSIPPISLYIFVSAVFFLIAFLISGPEERPHPAVNISRTDSAAQVEVPLPPAADTTARMKVGRGLRQAGEVLRKTGDDMEKLDVVNEVTDKFLHSFPKIFFFMIPFMAMLLRLLFIRRKSAPFVHHAVFSLHVHSFFFSLFLLSVLTPFIAADMIKDLTLSAVFAVYVVVAMRNTYRIGYGRAILNSVVVGLLYLLVGIVIMLAMLIQLAVKYGTGDVSF